MNAGAKNAEMSNTGASQQKASPKESQGKRADFGFKTVDEEEKAGLVHDVFASVASKYDVMNDVMSGGLHRLWKDRMVQLVPPFEGAKLLDIAGGTGDISFRFYRKAKALGHNVEIIVSDINEHMLEEGRCRAIDNNILKGILWKQADAEKLPFSDNQVDYITIAFGIRNVTHRDVALKEMYRVLKTGGKLVCMEFSHVDNPLLAKMYDAFSFGVIPPVGKIIAGDKESYQYLVESIRKFPDRETFAGIIGDAGFENVKWETLSAGAVAIHSGWKI